MRTLRACVLVALLVVCSMGAKAQRIALKTNLPYWGVGGMNAGLELRMSRHWTFNVEVEGDVVKRFRNFTATPEFRYWFQGRPMARHFVGVMGMASTYNLDVFDNFYNGTAMGLGLTYGYAFVLSKRLSLELSAGAGWLNFRDEANEDRRNVFTPMKLAVSLIYVLK